MCHVNNNTCCVGWKNLFFSSLYQSLFFLLSSFSPVSFFLPVITHQLFPLISLSSIIIFWLQCTRNNDTKHGLEGRKTERVLDRKERKWEKERREQCTEIWWSTDWWKPGHSSDSAGKRKNEKGGEKEWGGIKNQGTRRTKRPVGSQQPRVFSSSSWLVQY